MANINPRDSKGQRDLEDDVLDRTVNDTLEKFADVEPRAGLEQRVLARLRGQQEREAGAFLWRWATVVTLVAVGFVLSLSAVLHRVKPENGIALRRALVTTPNLPNLETHAANRGASNPIPAHRAGDRKTTQPRLVRHVATPAVSAPRLDRFPSPRPLSEQEKILQTYFSTHPEDAVLVARAWAEVRRRDAEEETSEATGMREGNSQQ
jgi:hypothetical protein